LPKARWLNICIVLYCSNKIIRNIFSVSDFSKKTGDYASLSATDIQVIALAYQLEKEHVGVDHLRTEPIKSVITPKGIPCSDFKEVAGFFLPKGGELEDVEDSEKETCSEEVEEPSAGDSEEVDDNGEEDDEWVDAEDEINEEVIEEENDDDDEGWITPSNIKEMKQKIISEVDVEVKPVVGCLTTDFAMQVMAALMRKNSV